ncbi:MAG: DUF1295 domain-containing protein [Chloroflexota bacterium]
MTDSIARITSGLLFLAFSAFALWRLRWEYKQYGKLTWFGTLIHVLVYGVQGVCSGIMVWGTAWMPPMGRLAWLGIPLVVIGLGITVYAMDLFHTFSRWLGSGAPGLQTNGLYRYSRNPQFVGYGLLIYGDSYREYCQRVPRYIGLPKLESEVK